MKKTTYLQSLLALALGFSATQSLAAQPAGDFYLSLGAGYQQRSDADDSAGTAKFKDGALLSGALGYKLNSFRLEAESLYLVNDFKGTDPKPSPLGDLPYETSGGDADGKAFMANLYYDFNMGGALKPYVGIGIGGLKGKINGLATQGMRNVPPPIGPIVVYAESPWVFARQVKVGASYSVTPRTDVFVGYRYFKSNDFSYTLTFSGDTIYPNAEYHMGEAGLRISF